MLPELHWLIYILIENKVITEEQCLDLLEKFGENIEVSSFAQEAFNYATKDMDEEHAELLLDKFEKAIELATDMAQRGETVPELPSLSENTIPIIPLDSSPVQLNHVPEEYSEIANYLKNILLDSAKEKASDLHISAGSPLFVRKSLAIKKIATEIISKEDSYNLNTVFLTDEQKEKFDKNNDLVYSLDFGDSKFRVSLMQHNDGIAGCYHILDTGPKPLKDLGILKRLILTVENFLDFYNGLILLTGPIGSGKTTTLASLVDFLNLKKKGHIITIEDPIEIVQKSASCNVSQREVSTHTKSYVTALKSTLREDPDIIVINELNNLEITEMAINAAESGHLVIATLPTNNVVNTLNRVVKMFPPSKQHQIQIMLANCLRGIISQKLIPDINGNLTIACEVLINNVSVSNNISEGKFYLLKPAMQMGKKMGMSTMDDYIYEIFREGTISEQVALNSLNSRKQYEKMINSSTL